MLEVGCNLGPNLFLIHKTFPKARLAGVDINEDSIKEAKTIIPQEYLEVAGISSLPFRKNSFDVVLSDAVLIYVNPEEIDKAMEELTRVAKKFIVLIEWFDKSINGVVKDYHWARDYTSLLKKYGFKVSKKKITKDQWPNKNWSTNGYIFIARRV